MSQQEQKRLILEQEPGQWRRLGKKTGKHTIITAVIHFGCVPNLSAEECLFGEGTGAVCKFRCPLFEGKHDFFTPLKPRDKDRGAKPAQPAPRLHLPV